MSFGFYRLSRFFKPREGYKWTSEYDFQSEELQNLIQQNPSVVQVLRQDLTTAQAASSPLQFQVPARGIIMLGTLTANAYDPVANTGNDAAEASAIVQCRFNVDRPENGIVLKHNRGFTGTFVQVFLSWPAQPGVSARIIFLKADKPIYMSEGEADNRFQGVVGSQISTVAAVSVSNVAATQIVAANQARKVTTLTNNGATNVWLGDATVTVGNGTLLIPGAIAKWANTAALFGISVTAPNLVAINTET